MYKKRRIREIVEINKNRKIINFKSDLDKLHFTFSPYLTRECLMIHLFVLFLVRFSDVFYLIYLHLYFYK